MNGLTDMAREPGEEASPLMPTETKYPYGLRVSLEDADLEKLGVDISDWEVGDAFPADVIFKLVSKSINDTEGGGSRKCVSLQITHIGAEEQETEEEEEDEDEDHEPSLEKHGYERIRYGK